MWFCKSQSVWEMSQIDVFTLLGKIMRTTFWVIGANNIKLFFAANFINQKSIFSFCPVTTGAEAAINEEIYGFFVVCCHVKNGVSGAGQPSIMQNLTAINVNNLENSCVALAQ